MWQQLLPGFRITLVLTILTGILYPLAVTGVSQILFPKQANGSLIIKDGQVIGSELISQNFKKPEYFHPRPSAAGSDGYDAGASSGSNLGPTSQKLRDRLNASAIQFRAENPEYRDSLPADLLTASGSGLDPHISPASATAQIARVANQRNAPKVEVAALVKAHTQGRDLGFMGEARVNVLMLNLALDERFPIKP